MGSKLGSPSTQYIPLSKADVIKIIQKQTSVLHKNIEKVRKNLFELEMKLNKGGIK